VTEEYQYSMGVTDSPTARFHAERYGDLPYEAFADQFRANLRRWNPDTWADLFQRAGARYVVLTTKTEDGFLLWPSRVPNPFKREWQVDRDVVGELAAAVRARGMEFGTYYSGWDWTFKETETSVTRPGAVARGPAWAAHANAQWRELIERYGTALLWSDFGVPAAGDWEALFHWYYGLVPHGVVNDRFDDEEHPELAVHADFSTLESVVREGGDYTAVPPDRKWESCRQMGSSWAYNRREVDDHYSTSANLIQELADVVARGGNLLLNVGPTGAGEIPWVQARRLLDIGWWLRRYGTAIYGTRRWTRQSGTTAAGQEVRFTVDDRAVHAIVLGAPSTRTPTDPHVELDIRLDPGAEVFLEDQPGALPWVATSHGVRIGLPEPPDEQPAIALRLSPPSAVRTA
jgi:alpha-L-fucosidase